VFAYSNRIGDERGLVVYHNKYAETRGWIKNSVASMDKASGILIQKTLSEALSLQKEGYTIFKDYVTGLEYIRSCQELTDKGLYFDLGGYQCHVFLDWRFVYGEQWKIVCELLNGGGVPSAYLKFDEMFAMKVEGKIGTGKKVIKSKKVKSVKKAVKPRKNQTKPKSTVKNK
jgi:hypothetical protein